MAFDAAEADRQWRLDATLPGLLPRYLTTQRWFAGKGRTIARVGLADHAWLPAGADGTVITWVDVVYTAGDPERYCLWLGLRDAPGAGPVVGPGGLAADRWFVDVAADPQAMPGLLRPLAAGRDLPTARGGAVQFADVDAATAAVLVAAPEVRALASEQSNTSIRIGDRLVFKLFRRQQPGLNPEVEIGRFLTTRTTFQAFAALRGSVTYVAPDGTAATMGVLQDWVDNVSDGWRYAVSRLEDHLQRPGAWPTVREDLLTLGATTYAFHRALASDAAVPDFAPEAVSAADVEHWRRALSDRASRLSHRVAAGNAGEEWTAPLVQALRGVVEPGAALTPPIVGSGHFHRIRVHGDFHLGQTLKTPSGFVLVDFEGEPTRPIAERRQKHCALKDVAGMVRSFDYAVAVAGAVPDRMAALHDAFDLRSAFLEGYFAAAEGGAPAFLPGDDAARRRWLRFFELDKALYELEYELDSRPAWAHIPALGLLRVLDA
jgi:trehalose synthase-fused probable maltokinase